MEKQCFTRKELYDLVWSAPMLTLSKKYAVSDTGLRKICIRYNIPVPKSGHWVRVQFKKKVVKPPLRSTEFDSDTIELVLRSSELQNLKGEPTPQKLMEQQLKAKLQSKLTVPERSHTRIHWWWHQIPR